MSDDNSLCIKWPDAQRFTVPLPFGGTLAAITDISNGPPTECALLQSMMLQLAPMLAGMTCLLRVLAVIGALKDFATNPTKPGALIDKINEMQECLGMVIDPCAIVRMVAAILDIIVRYLTCLIQAFESIYNFQVGIDLNAAADNPVLLANLQCAQENAEIGMKSMNDSMQGVMPLLELINTVLGVVGQKPIEIPPMVTPSLAEAGGQKKDPMEPIIALRDALKKTQMALAAACP